MRKNLFVALVAGARPNFMKVAPLYHALAARKEAARAKGIDLRVSIVHTGQHYDENMSEVFFRELGIPKPDRHLEVGSGSHAEQTARIEGGGFRPSPAIRDFCGAGRPYAVLTLHRPSNVDRKETLAPIWGAIAEISRRIPVLFPVHPRTRAKIAEFGLDGAGVSMIDPVGYLDMLCAVNGAAMVLTDSGGLQEETTVELA